MQIVVDEWIIDYLSPKSEALKVEVSHSFTKAVKVKCDKLVFSPEHLRRIRVKAENFRGLLSESFYFPLVLKPLVLLLYDSDKAEARSVSIPPNLVKNVPPDDIPVVESAFSIPNRPKLIVTTDQRLKDTLSSSLESYGIQCVLPEDYIAGRLHLGQNSTVY